MISAKKAREIIESYELNKAEIDATLDFLDKRVREACARKEYNIDIVLYKDKDIPDVVRLVLKTEALRKHIDKELSKEDYKTEYHEGQHFGDSQTYFIDWTKKKDENEKPKRQYRSRKKQEETETIEADDQKEENLIPEIPLIDLPTNEVPVPKDIKQTITPKQYAPTSNQKSVVEEHFGDDLDFSEFQKAIPYGKAMV